MKTLYLLLLVHIVTFHICIITYLLYAGKMAEGSRITHPYWTGISAPSSLEAGGAAGRSHPLTSSSSSLACTAMSSIHTVTVRRRGVTHLKTNSAESNGWFSPGAVLHHDCMKTAAGSARAGMGVEPLVWQLCHWGATSSETQETEAGAEA